MALILQIFDNHIPQLGDSATLGRLTPQIPIHSWTSSSRYTPTFLRPLMSPLLLLRGRRLGPPSPLPFLSSVIVHFSRFFSALGYDTTNHRKARVPLFCFVFSFFGILLHPPPFPLHSFAVVWKGLESGLEVLCKGPKDLLLSVFHSKEIAQAKACVHGYGARVGSRGEGLAVRMRTRTRVRVRENTAEAEAIQPQKLTHSLVRNPLHFKCLFERAS